MHTTLGGDLRGLLAAGWLSVCPATCWGLNNPPAACWLLSVTTTTTTTITQ
jgi:hypothetical protein